METLKKYFPLSFKERKTGGELAVGIIVYVVIAIVAAIVIGISGLLTGIPVLGAILNVLFKIAGIVVDAYVTAGIVLQILYFCKVLKD